MANTNAPFGLIPIRAANGENKLNAYGRYSLADAYGTKLVKNEAVVLAGTLNANDPTRMNVARGAGTNEIMVGVVDSFNYFDATGQYHSGVDTWPASTSVLAGTVCEVNVYDDPAQQFLVQGNSESWVAADSGLNVDYTPGTAGTSGYKARSVLVRTGINTTATLMFRLLGLAPVGLHIDGVNDIGPYCRWIVRPNYHAHSTGTGA